MSADHKTPPDLALLQALETEVWQALVTGDAGADRARLAEDFLGVYPSGFSGKDGHSGQLDGGPTVAEYRISQARMQVYGPDMAMFCYRADYLRPGRAVWEAMYVSSLWRRDGGTWLNRFSQDTPVGGAVP